MTVDELPASDTISRFEAWRLPRGNIVIEFPSRRVEAEFDTYEECQVHAQQLNSWLEGRPMPDRRYRLWTIPPEPTEARLFLILDRMLHPETMDPPTLEEAA